ncbi:division/cell wall cluster transcriptional repressor MraZ [Mangrovicoccus ximenensis]|uniref:division/cell wall cluster transcriptional repressor MraZ n=1 Tax=Mangrovicoccus ximenensis TaxID=1911570 RepID=UPI001375256B|nr:cell division/cell wall cluster transcriptional repressor MraZ [Mangrovicoccus ximenensis]
MLCTFRGEFGQKIDAKGRVSIPAQIRKVLDAGDPDRESGEDPNLIIVFGDTTRSCLLGYSQQAMAEVEAKIHAMKASPRKKALVKAFLTLSWEARVDTTGRIVLPKHLRTRLGLGETGELTFAGGGEKFEIWNSVDYEAEAAAFDLTEVEGYEEGMDLSELLDMED